MRAAQQAAVTRTARRDRSRRMARPRLYDLDAVLDRSMRQFWGRGYRETSVDDILMATGMQAGSLYNAFPGGKRALFLLALDRYSKLIVPAKMGALQDTDAGLAELRGYFDGLVDDLTSAEGQAGCLMVNSTMELA